MGGQGPPHEQLWDTPWGLDGRYMRQLGRADEGVDIQSAPTENVRALLHNSSGSPTLHLRTGTTLLP
jgi:hypothetical protein